MSCSRTYLSFFLVLTTTSALRADSVYVRTGEDAQGITRARGGDCYVITVAHPLGVEQKGKVVGTGGASATAQLVESYNEDLAILKIENDPDVFCRKTWPTVSSSTDMIPLGNLQVQTVAANGAVKYMDVVISDSDDRHLRLKPRTQGDAFYQSMSGSVVAQDGVPLAIIVGINQDDQTANALRIGFVSDVLNSFFKAESAPTNLTGLWTFAISHAGFAGIGAQTYERPTDLENATVVRIEHVGTRIRAVLERSNAGDFEGWQPGELIWKGDIRPGATHILGYGHLKTSQEPGHPLPSTKDLTLGEPKATSVTFELSNDGQSIRTQKVNYVAESPINLAISHPEQIVQLNLKLEPVMIFRLPANTRFKYPSPPKIPQATFAPLQPDDAVTQLRQLLSDIGSTDFSVSGGHFVVETQLQSISHCTLIVEEKHSVHSNSGDAPYGKATVVSQIPLANVDIDYTREVLVSNPVVRVQEWYVRVFSLEDNIVEVIQADIGQVRSSQKSGNTAHILMKTQELASKGAELVRTIAASCGAK